MRPPLTSEQKRAATTSAEFAYIESGPGSGKTTVAAERYGVLRYGARSAAAGRGVVALSFARSARGELESRIRKRWGATALRWPHKVWTLDSLHHALVGHLLRTRAIEWPGGHTELTVLDTWRGQRGSRSLTPDFRWCRVVTLNGRRVVSTGRRIGRFTFGYGRKEPYEAMLADGICTHDEIRQVLLAALRSDAIRPVVGEYLKDAARSVIIDEVFDGNRLDLAIVLLAVDAHISTTLIGDPWQALYEFRGAEPALVPAVIAGRGFTTLPVTQSFRFRTALTRDIAHALRDGRSVKVPKGTADTSDVVLAALWEPLWGLSDAVLPLSFGQIGNRTDAAISLLLDRLVASRLGDEMAPGLESALILGLDPQVLRSDAAAALAPVYERLSGGSYADAESGLTLLRSTLREMGSLNITRLQSAQEQRRVNRLLALSRRMARDQLVPGMTIHQAKGREWPRVGVHLSAAQLSRLDAGLSSDDQGDRAVYVALTRAQDTIQLL